MRRLLPVGLVLLFRCASNTCSGESIPGDYVLTLDSESLEAAISRNGVLMLDFYTPWCGHCQALEPEYAKAAADLRDDDIYLGKIDCDANEQLCEEDRWDVEGFPTMKVVNGNTIHDYEGPRRAEDIVHFMRGIAKGHLNGLHGQDNGDSEAMASLEGDLARDGADGAKQEDIADAIDIDGIFMLRADTVEAMVDQFVLTMIHFYYPSCADCSELALEYSQAGEELFEYLIPLAKVDCHANKKMCDDPKWNASALPTFKAVREGVVFDFGDRSRTAEGFVKFMKDLAGIDDYYTELSDEDADKMVDESSVLVLTNTTIDDALRDYDPLLIEFFAPWCGNCRRFKPRYARAAHQLKDEGITLAKVDCEQYELLCDDKRWFVQAFPTLYVKRRGVLHEYHGPHEAEDVTAFMRNIAKPSPEPMNDAEDLTRFVDGEYVAIVGVFAGAEGDGRKLYQACVDADIKLKYGISTSREVREAHGATTEDKVIVFKDFDEGRSEMAISASTTLEELQKFIRLSSQPLVLEQGSEIATEVLRKTNGVVVFLFTDDDGAEGPQTTAALAAGRAAAKTNRETVTHIHAAANDKGTGIMDYMFGPGMWKGRLPAAGLVFGRVDVEKYLYDGEMTGEGLLEFERLFFEGKLSRYVKSEKVSARDTEGPLKVVKGETFRDMVMNNDDDVLVEFYAPWCKHCQALEPTYTGFAERVSGREHLIVAKMDATANDINHPQVVVKSFPRIMLFPAHSKDAPVLYQGGHDISELETFLNEQAYHKHQHVRASDDSDESPGTSHEEL